MPAIVEREMAQIKINVYRSLSNHLGGCEIGDEGCEYLSRALWPQFCKTNLGYFIKMKGTIE